MIFWWYSLSLRKPIYWLPLTKRSKKLIFTAVGGLTVRHWLCLLWWFRRIPLTGSQSWFPWQPQMRHDCIMFDSPNIISAPPWDLVLVCLSSLCLWKACSSERLWKLIFHLFLGKKCPFAYRDLHFQSSKWDWAPLQTSLPGPEKFFPGGIKENLSQELKLPTTAHQVEVADRGKNNRLILILCEVENRIQTASISV